jgi:hypothetical protein
MRNTLTALLVPYRMSITGRVYYGVYKIDTLCDPIQESVFVLLLHTIDPEGNVCKFVKQGAP